MDENKNWINYKRFDANSYYIFKSNEINNTGGWYMNKHANAPTPSMSDSLITLINTGASGHDVLIETCIQFDFSLYDNITINYSTSSVTAFAADEFRHSIGFNPSTRYTSYTYVAEKTIKFAMISPTSVNVFQQMTIDISDINTSCSVFFSWTNNGNNTLRVSDIYLWNN